MIHAEKSDAGTPRSEFIKAREKRKVKLKVAKTNVLLYIWT